MIHELFPALWGRRDRTPEYRKATIKRCNAVICVSESTRNDLLGMIDVDPDKVHVIHHGFEHMGVCQDIDAIEKSKLSALTGCPYLLYVGGRQGYKNFSRFLQGFAISRLSSQMKVVAFGGGPLTAAERSLIAELGISPSGVIQLSGSDALLEHLYRNAVAFVYPSQYEGFGFPPLEAMAQDCPVIASNTSSMPEVIGDAAEYFDPLDVDSISTALSVVVNNAVRRSSLVDLGRNRVNNFSWHECARKTFAVYRKFS
jgi:glycosyltransferase involved in cell wall biosynthesis